MKRIIIIKTMEKVSSIAISEKGKGRIRAERIGKESFDESITRILDELEVLRGNHGADAKDTAKLVHTLAGYLGVDAHDGKKIIYKYLKDNDKRKTESMRAGVASQRLQIKVKAIQNVLIALTGAITVLGVIFYGIV